MAFLRTALKYTYRMCCIGHSHRAQRPHVELRHINCPQWGLRPVRLSLSFCLISRRPHRQDGRPAHTATHSAPPAEATTRRRNRPGAATTHEGGAPPAAHSLTRFLQFGAQLLGVR